MDTKHVALSRGLFIVTAMVAILYLPLALNYTWPLFSGDVSRWQDGVNTAINGRGYALGDGSVEVVRHSAYAEHRVVLLVHTTLGALALLLAMFQFSARLRERRPAAHRWTGRAYLALMSTSMVTALIFLYVTPPAQHFIGPAFETQLRGLAVGTLASAWYALYAIRNRDVVTHRAWMTYSIAFMMAAPLLRFIWIGIQPLIPQHDVLTNIGVGSLILGVAAPGAAAFAFMLSESSRLRDSQPRAASTPIPLWPYGAAAGLAVLGSLAYTGLTQRLPAPIPHSLVAFHLVPVWICVAIAAVGVARARTAGDTARERQWRWLLWGFAAAPTSASLYSLIVPPDFTAADAIIAGGMDGAAIPITIGFAVVVRVVARSRTDDPDGVATSSQVAGVER
ncbi:membrane protein, PF10067 family [Mycolicibacterium canariasense]|uniref:Membrane protein, PF10067 family n=1 Tax=Mycolicibacterium canariasense TaxID=228230 RepID=A0A100WDA8_MYCCR|nr:DUF2306 domain-containing protein [Mycolicibacterium canariasense]MCV7210841.1 DUF2306 domain-containing protein [Mycolicibacterium canariasense]ORU99262.1 hypothetical protein AWB94_27990 [Mycolicibacterium canariasense]GAS96419.1 membrane protein, PF10067 family [Mycolicibacterium canariasense]